jgi:hypothetical protein
MNNRSARYRTVAAFVIVGALLFAAAGQSSAQQGSNLVITQIDASHFPTVDVYIGKRDISTTKLGPQQVTLKEGIEDKAVVQTVAQRGVSVLVLVDLHRRMRGIGMPGTDRLETARQAIDRLADTLLQNNPDGVHFGVIGYHRDLIQIMPFQLLHAKAVDEAIGTAGATGRLFTILPKLRRSPANDPADPHAQSALSLAVRAAATQLKEQAPAGQQQVIVIIGSTCSDLRPDLTTRENLYCDLDARMVTQLQEQQLLSIVSVGVGSEDSAQPQVLPRNREDGFNYAADFRELEKLTKLLSPQSQVFKLHATDVEQAQLTWDNFIATVARPITNQGEQLKISFQAAPQRAGDHLNSRKVVIELAGQTVHGAYEPPRLDLLINGTPISSSSIGLTPGPQAIEAQVRSGAVNIVIPTAVATTAVDPTATPPAATSTPATEGAPYHQIQVYSLFAAALALLLATIVGAAWLEFRHAEAASREPPDERPKPSPPPPDKNQGQSSYILQTIRGTSPERTFLLDGSLALIGSDEEVVQFHINSPYVSPRHVALEERDELLYVKHRGGGLFKTFVNHQPLLTGEEKRLNHNDLLTVGETTFRCTYGRGRTGRLQDTREIAAKVSEANHEHSARR